MRPPTGDQFPEVREEYDPTPGPGTPGLTATFTFTPTESMGPTPDLNSMDPEKVGPTPNLNSVDPDKIM